MAQNELSVRVDLGGFDWKYVLDFGLLLMYLRFIWMKIHGTQMGFFC